MENQAEGDRGSMLLRCASQSSLDESSQRPVPAGGVGVGGEGAAAAEEGGSHADALLGALGALRRERVLCDVLLCARDDTLTHTRTSPGPQYADSQRSMPESESAGASVPSGSGGGTGGGTGGGGGGVTGGGVPAHRAVLAAYSPYFRAMFTQFDERTMHTITIQNVDPEALEMIVEYIYNPDSLCITEDNVQSLVSAASLLSVHGVGLAGSRWLAEALAPDNALGIRSFALLHASGELAQRATRYVHRHFLQVCQHEEFLALPAHELADLLAADELCTSLPPGEGAGGAGGAGGEQAVLDAALRWWRHDEGERQHHLAMVLAQVRLPLLPHEVLVSCAQQPPLVNAAVEVKDLIIEALSYHLLRPSPPCASPCASVSLAPTAAGALCRARPRHTPRKPKIMMVVGGQAPKAIRDVECYELPSSCGGPEGAGGGAGGGAAGGGKWTSGRELLTRRCRAGLAMLDNKVYAVGGFNGTLRVRSVDVYDAARDVWSAGPPLLARRSTLGVAVLDRKIYAVGGFDGATGLSSCEVLEPAGAGQGAGHWAWRATGDMTTRRSSVGVCVLDGRLYAVGGYDGASRQCLASVERYDPVTETWSPVESMSARRSGAGVGVCGGWLWALGGHDGPAVRRSVERYSPNTGWQAAPSMLSARRNAAVLAHEGRLYVVGGDDGATNLNTVEVLDPVTETWSVLDARMSVGRSYAGVVLVERPD